jgi:hypothetical protein
MLKNCACDISTSVPSEVFHEVDRAQFSPCSIKKTKIMLAIVGVIAIMAGVLLRIVVFG